MNKMNLLVKSLFLIGCVLLQGVDVSARGAKSTKKSTKKAAAAPVAKPAAAPVAKSAVASGKPAGRAVPYADDRPEYVKVFGDVAKLKALSTPYTYATKATIKKPVITDATTLKNYAEVKTGGITKLKHVLAVTRILSGSILSQLLEATGKTKVFSAADLEKTATFKVTTDNIEVTVDGKVYYVFPVTAVKPVTVAPAAVDKAAADKVAADKVAADKVAADKVAAAAKPAAAAGGPAGRAVPYADDRPEYVKVFGDVAKLKALSTPYTYATKATIKKPAITDATTLKNYAEVKTGGITKLKHVLAVTRILSGSILSQLLEATGKTKVFSAADLEKPATFKVTTDNIEVTVDGKVYYVFPVTAAKAPVAKAAKSTASAVKAPAKKTGSTSRKKRR